MTNKQKGILCIILSAFFFALMNVFVKLSGPLPSMEKSFFRNLVALIVAGGILMKNRQDFKLQKAQIPVLLARSLFGTIGILGNFYAVDHLLLADASAIQKLVPFVTILASFVILKEPVKSWQIFCIVLAFGASLLVIKPSFGNVSLIPSLAAAAGAICAGIAYTLVRKLSQMQVPKAFIIFFFSAFSCLAMVPFMMMDFVMPSGLQLTYLLMAGAAASGGQFAVTYAYSYAPASQISIFDYSQIVFSALFGLILFGQVSDPLSFAGYILIVLAALLNYGFQKKAARNA